MKKLLFLLMAILAILPTASMAKGFYTGFGAGINADGGTAFLVGGHFGFRAIPILGIVVEGTFHTQSVFDVRTNGIAVGGGADIFILAFTRHKLIIDPYIYGRGGFDRTFGDAGDNGGYARFGGGVPFDLGVVKPYAELGVNISFGHGDSQGSFNLAGGLRFNL
jgi:hypothetical protein